MISVHFRIFFLLEIMCGKDSLKKLCAYKAQFLQGLDTYGAWLKYFPGVRFPKASLANYGC